MDIERFNKIITVQEKRGFDKYFLAPFLLFVGLKYKKLPKKVRRLLVGAGIFQIFYSWQDYMELQGKLVQAAKDAAKGGQYG